MMSKAVYDYSHDQIEQAFQNKNIVSMEKETDYVFTKILATFSTLFSDRISGISVGDVSFSEQYLLSPKHKEKLFKWLDRLYNLKLPVSDAEFGKLKIDFELWYYEMGGDFIEFSYPKSYLLKPSEAAKMLGVSTVTLNKYIKQGLECVNNGSQHKIPKHAVELLRDPVYGVLMQMVGQKKKRMNQTPDDRMTEIYKEISQLQLKYKVKTLDELLKISETHEEYDPMEYYRWKDLEEELDEILRIAGGIK